MANEIYAFIGSGDMRVNVKNPDGIFKGFSRIGNVTSSIMTNKVEKIIIESTGKYDAGEAIVTAVQAKPREGSIVLDAFSKQALAIAVMSALNEAKNIAGSMSEKRDNAYFGLDVYLGEEYTSNLVLSTPTAGTGTLYTTDAVGYSIGDKVINIITGTGTVLEGDTITFAGDTNQYVVSKGVAAAGVITLLEGLKQAIPASATAMTIKAAIAALSIGVDYEIDAKNSSYFRTLEGGAVAEGAPVLQAFSYAASEASMMNGGITSVDAQIIIDGVNKMGGKDFILKAYNVTLTSPSGFDFIGKEAKEITIEVVFNLGDDPELPLFGKAFELLYEKEEIV